MGVWASGRLSVMSNCTRKVSPPTSPSARLSAVAATPTHLKANKQIRKLTSQELKVFRYWLNRKLINSKPNLRLSLKLKKSRVSLNASYQASSWMD
jgi:hypothetical protein